MYIYIYKLVYNSNNYGLFYLSLWLMGLINQLITGGPYDIICKCQFSSGFSHMFDDTRGCSKKAKQNTKKCEILLRRFEKILYSIYYSHILISPQCIIQPGHVLLLESITRLKPSSPQQITYVSGSLWYLIAIPTSSISTYNRNDSKINDSVVSLSFFKQPTLGYPAIVISHEIDS